MMTFIEQILLSASSTIEMSQNLQDEITEPPHKTEQIMFSN